MPEKQFDVSRVYALGLQRRDVCELGGVGKAVVQAHHHPAMQEADAALVRDAAAALLRSIVKPLFAFLRLPAKDRRLRAGVQASVEDACTIKNLAVCAFESLGRG